ncbi:MAG: tetratricopeptide repeat protein, partial [Candidatus Coatesbacteria bacterium]|nr:tetratricopeptide repeat protein [Candidatus Coatesbacteria bacterium]
MKKIRINWGKAKDHYSRGIIHLEKGDIRRAISAFDKAIQVAPRFAGAYIDRGNCYATVGGTENLNRAIEDFGKALEIDPGAIDARLSRATARWECGLYDLALEDAKLVLNTTPDSPDANNLLGMFLHNKGKIQDAIGAYSKAIEAEPSYLWPLCNRARAYELINQFDNACEDYDSALEVDPNSTMALTGLTDLIHRTGDFKRGIERLNKTVEAEPDDGFPLMLRGDLHSWNGDEDAALSDFDAALKLLDDPDELAELHARRADHYMEYGDVFLALEELDKAIEESPRDPNLFVRRGIFALQGDENQMIDDAIIDFGIALELDPTNRTARISRARARAMLKDFDRAIEDLDECIDFNSDDAEAYTERALIRADLGKDLELVVSDCDRLLDIAPNRVDAHAARATIFTMIHRYREAVAESDKALELKPISPEMHSIKGKALHLCGDIDLAIASFNKAIELNPRFREAYLFRASVLKEKGDKQNSLDDYMRAMELGSSEERKDGESGNNESILKSSAAIAGIAALVDSLGQVIDLFDENDADGSTEDAARAVESSEVASVEGAKQLVKELARLKSRNPEECLDGLSALIKHMPYSSELLILRALLTMTDTGDNKKPIKDLEKALEIDPDNPMASFVLGAAYFKSGRFDEAICHLDCALELNPDYHDARALRGEVHNA